MRGIPGDLRKQSTKSGPSFEGELTSDNNYDGMVSFVEAYWKEVENLSGTGQDPVLYQ
ncbi:MAG: hypothetical protein QCI82_11445 [Candidatus Thermoplasmatota archaeon]|nr:hypothetical protein [Candidatus Thermoplasmatota archaeon]